MKNIGSFVSRKISRAIFQYEMFRPGDRVLAAVSGGKDSMVLARDLHRKQKSFPVPFTLDCIHLKTEFTDPGEETRLNALFQEWGIPLISLDLQVEALLKPGKKMSCFWCASLRRKTLLRYALEQGYDVLALGHHMDDILESLLMNMVYNSELSVMVPHLEYRDDLRLVRPLCLAAEDHVREAAVSMGIPGRSCRCPHEGVSRRKQVRKALDLLTDDSPALKNNMYSSLSRLKLDFLPAGALEKIQKNTKTGH